MKNYTFEERKQILKMASDIGVTKTSKIYKISRFTISNWRKKVQEKGLSALKNRSRDKQYHPFKIDNDTTKKIINLKKRNNKLTAKEIILSLDKEVSKTYVYNTLKKHGLSRKSERSKANLIFRKLILSVFKVKTGVNIPKYQIMIKDIYSDMQFSGFSYERTDINVSIFLDFFFNGFFNSGFTKKVELICKPVTSSSHSYILNELKKKYNLDIKDFNTKTERNVFNSYQKNYTSSFKLNKPFDLLINTAINETFLNCGTFKKLKEQNCTGLMKVGKFLNYFIPIITDQHITKRTQMFRTNEYWHILNTESIFSKYLDYIDNILLSENCLQDCESCISNVISFVEVFRKRTANKRLAFIYLKISSLNYIRRSDKEAEKYLHKIIKMKKSLKNEEVLYKAYEMLGKLRLRKGQKKQAEYYSNKHLKWALNCKDLVEIGRSYLNRSLIYSDLSNNTKRLNLLKKAYENLVKGNDTESIISINIQLGSIFFNRGEYNKAENKYLKAISMSHKYRIYQEIPKVYANLGALYITIRESEKATEYCQKALKEYLERGDNLTVAIILNNLGNIYAENRDYIKAMKAFNKLLKISNELGNTKFKSLSYGNIALTYLSINKLEAADVQVDKAIIHAKKSKNYYYLVKHYQTKAEIKFQQGKYNKAKIVNDMNIRMSRKYEIEESIFETGLMDIKINFMMNYSNILKRQILPLWNQS